VLVAAITTLSALELVLAGGRPVQDQPLMFVLPVLCGLCIAPFFTMLCRSPLAGIVFTLAMPAAMMLGGPAILQRGMLAASALAAFFSGLLFMRLEAIDGSATAVRLPWVHSAEHAEMSMTAPRQRHPLWLLVKKELRLQQLTFVVAGLYVVGWFGIKSMKSTAPATSDTLLSALVVLTTFALCLLAGSLASAEERQLGTLEWHALLPQPARTQWAIKVAVVVVVAVVLGLGTPILLASLGQGRGVPGVYLSSGAVSILAVIFLSLMSLYISSLSATGLQALLWSVLASIGLLMVVNALVGMAIHSGFLLSLAWWEWSSFSTRSTWLLRAIRALAVAMYGGGMWLLLRFGRANHTSAELSARRLSRQVLWLGMFVVVVMSLGLVEIGRASCRERV